MALLKNLGQKLASFFGQDTDIDFNPSEGQALNQLEMNFLSSLLPYRLYDPVTKIFENKSSYGFFFELIPLLGMDANSQKQISALIRDLGEEGASVQCMIWADPRVDPFFEGWSKARESMGGIYSKIAEKKKAFFTTDEFSGEIPPRIFRIFFSYSIPKPAESKCAFLLKQLSEKRQKALSALNQFKVVLESSVMDFLDLVSGFLNFEQDTKVYKRKKWFQETFLSNQICLPSGELEVYPNELKFKGNKTTLFKTYEAIDFPDYWSMFLQQELIGDFMSDVHRIPAPFYIHYGIYFPNQDQSEMKLKSKAKYLDHQTKSSYINRMVPQIREELEENLFVTKELKSGEKIVNTRLSMGFWSPPEDVLKVETAVESLYRKYGFKLQQNKFHHLNDLLFSLPMSWGESSKMMKQLKKHMCLRTTYTVETSNFISMIAEWWGNSREGMILFGRRGQITSWDPFKTSGNLNMVVVGASGQGKSVFMQDLILSELGRGGRVFVLDLGRSFEKLCLLLNGQYLFFNENSNLNLNPFHIVKKTGSNENINLYIDMVSSIVATMAMPHEQIDKERMNLLSSAVKKAWESKNSSATIDDLLEIIQKTTFKSELMKGAVESLCEGLKKYTTTGAYRNYFYGSADIDFKNDLVVIETEELKNMPDLQAVIMQIFALNISGQIFMGDREKRSYVCIDEGWDLLKSPQMEGFIESMARRLRKYNGALIVGTQSLNDFERSRGAKAAFFNSNWIVTVGGNAELVKSIQEKEIIPGMDESLAGVLRSMRKEDGKYGECFIYNKSQEFGSLSRLILDPFSAALYSTKAEEFHIIQELGKRGFNIEDAVEWLIQNKKQVQALQKSGFKTKEILLNLLRPIEKRFALTEKCQKISASNKPSMEISS